MGTSAVVIATTDPLNGLYRDPISRKGRVRQLLPDKLGTVCPVYQRGDHIPLARARPVVFIVLT